MVNFATKILQDLQTLISPKVINVALHAIMLLLCLVGSVIFVFDFLQPPVYPTPKQYFFSFWSIEMATFWITTFFNFVKIKILIPVLIFGYFYFCAKQKVFQKLLKEDYNQKYVEKYSKIHKIDFNQDKNTQKQTNVLEQSSIHQSQSDETQKNFWSKEGDSSLNISKDMVRSMNRSILGSMRSVGNSNLTQSMIDKGNLSMRSSKIIQNLSKKLIEGTTGKDLSTLYQKGRNMSESFMSISSSGIEGEDTKIRIKNKKYYDFINQNQGQQFRKWYEESNSKYLQQLKTYKKDPRNYYADLMQLKRGLQKQFTSFLKEYKENTEAIKECIVRFWSVKIEAFESKKPFKTSYELSSLFKDNPSGNSLNLAGKQNSNDLVLNESTLFKQCSSPSDFLRHMNRLKANLRNPRQKDFAEKQLLSILSKRTYLNTSLNITTIEGQLFSNLQTSKLKTLQKSLNALTTNKLDIFTFSRNGIEVTEMDLLEQFDIETIKEMIELRMSMLIFIVNKINLMSGDKQFKVKMKLAVTYDSGFLNTAINFFHNKNFAEIQCDKSFDNVFSHFNLKVFRSAQGQQSPIDNLIYCKPGIDNSISVMLSLVKQISEDLSQNHRFDERLTFEEKRKDETFRQFIDGLYVSRIL